MQKLLLFFVKMIMFGQLQIRRKKAFRSPNSFGNWTSEVISKTLIKKLHTANITRRYKTQSFKQVILSQLANQTK